MAIDINSGTALVDGTANAASGVNSRFTTMEGSIEDALSSLTEITDGVEFKTTSTATGAIKTVLKLEWDPSDGAVLTDNASGISIDFVMPDSAANQDVFARVVSMVRSDTSGSEEGELAFRAITGGTDTEIMTVSGAGVTVGVNDTGYDVKFFGAAAGAYLLYDQSEDTLEIRGPSADATTSTGKLKLTTALTDIRNLDVLGRIDFAAPLEAGGTDAILVGASIWAEAGGTFAADLNDTDLVFAVAQSETAAERMRLSYDGTNVALAFTGGDLTITSGGGDISFDNENLSTTGTLASGALTVTGTVTGTGLDINGAADISGDLTLSAGADGALRFSAASSIKILDNSATSLVIEEADNAYMTFVTSNSAEKISFAKTAFFPDSVPITLGTGSDATLQFNATNTVLATAGAFICQINGTTEAMRINAAGNVGINEASPAASTNTTRLHISNGTAIGALRVDGQAASALEMVDEAASSSFRFYFDDDVLYMQMGSTADPTTSNANSMRIDASSNVGIGGLHGSPSKFEVWGGELNASTPTLKVADGVVSVGAANEDANVVFTVKDRLGDDFFITDTANSRVQMPRGNVYIGLDTSNSYMTQGITINQAANDNEILAFKSTGDVSHNMSDLTEVDTWGTVKKRQGAAGGMKFSGYSDTTIGLSLQAFENSVDTTKGIGGTGAIELLAGLRSGIGATDPSADANMVVIRTNAGTTRFIFDVEGTGHADVAWTTYDRHDDIAIINDMEAELLAHEDEAKTGRRHALEALGVIGKGSWHMEHGKPRAMVNFTKLSMLHHGALIQIGQAYEDLKTRLALAENKLAQLTA